MIQDILGITDCYYALSSEEYYVYDNHINDKPYFVKENEDWSLQIVNKSNQKIHFYQNDNCLMKQNELKKCDWLCFDENDFYFIEAKAVKARQRKKERKDAIAKFNHSIPFILELCPAITEINIHVVVNFKMPKKLTSAANKQKRAYFKEKYNAKYLEQNFIEF